MQASDPTNAARKYRPDGEGVGIATIAPATIMNSGNKKIAVRSFGSRTPNRRNAVQCITTVATKIAAAAHPSGAILALDPRRRR
jgi:hypothetical protein